MPEHEQRQTRRDLMRLAAAGAVGIPFLSSASEVSAGDQRPAFPPDVGSKFYPDGRVKPFAGNTILCHLPQQGEHTQCFDAMLDIYREAPLRRFIQKVALLPPSSYHMTVFGGATDQSRKAGNWPADLSKNATIRRCNDEVGSRLRQFRADIALPIRMRIDPEQKPANGRALTFRLKPVDAAEEAKLRGLHDRLADAPKIRGDGHDTYRFHISLGYPIAWFDLSEERDLQQTWQRWSALIAARAAEIVLAAPEYCTFDDMFAFQRRFFLQ